MTVSQAPLAGPDAGAACPSATRRELLAAATALIASAATSSPAQAQAGAEGYFLVFDNPSMANNLDRVFFIPSAWLELFEVTDVYKARFPTNWQNALAKVRTAATPGKKQRFHVLYADTVDPDVIEALPGLTVVSAVPPGAGQTYLAAMISP
jgi:hypothetical protein